VLDKSKGLVLGAEALPIGTFDSPTGWVVGGGCSVSGGNMNYDATGGAACSAFTDSSLMEAGKTYKITLDCTAFTGAGGIRVALSNNNSAFFDVTQAGVITGYLTCVAGTYATRFSISRVYGDFTATLATITVQEIAGNHLVQATAAARPLYQSSGGLHWLKYDGVDDGMATASTVDFTATDKMGIFTGLTSTVSSTSMICELSTNTTVPGTFYALDGIDGAQYDASLSHGMATAAASHSAHMASALVGAKVCSYSHDIAGDLSTMRRNGVAGTSGTLDKGTGNFSNQTLYVGARGGTSLYLNGQINQLVVLGRLPTSQEIDDTEQFIADKTGVTLP